MQITLNGKIEETLCRDILALVLEKGLDPVCLVIEHNRQVVRQEAWAKTPLNQGDAIELLNFVGGG